MFEDIKVGDIVLAEDRVAVSMFDWRYFLVPYKVVKVTKTQFYIGGVSHRFNKSNGRMIGGDYRDRVEPYTEECDQTEDMENFKNQVALYKRLHRLKDELNDVSVDSPHDFIKPIVELLEQAVKLKKYHQRAIK